MYCNLGIGIPTMAANYVPKGVSIELQSENGLLGMVFFFNIFFYLYLKFIFIKFIYFIYYIYLFYFYIYIHLNIKNK